MSSGQVTKSALLRHFLPESDWSRACGMHKKGKTGRWPNELEVAFKPSTMSHSIGNKPISSASKKPIL